MMIYDMYDNCTTAAKALSMALPVEWSVTVDKNSSPKKYYIWKGRRALTKIFIGDETEDFATVLETAHRKIKEI